MANRARGALASPRHLLAGAVPHRMVGATPPQFARVPGKLSMWLNSTYGDCVTAEEAFAKACYDPEIFITDAVVKDWATAHGVLNGAYLLQVIQWMQKKGFQQGGQTFNDGAASSVDWTNGGLIRNAIVKGPVKIGVAANQLERVVGSKNGWFGTGFRKDTNLDHCVSLCGYGTFGWMANRLGVTVPRGLPPAKRGYMLFTWNTIGIVDIPSMVAITGEAWLRTPTTIVK